MQTVNNHPQIVDQYPNQNQQMEVYTPEPPAVATPDMAAMAGIRPGMDADEVAERMMMLTTYTGVEPQEIAKYANMELNIIGCCIQTVDEFVDRKTGEVKDGFTYALWKCDKLDADGNNIVFKISSRQGMQFTTQILGPIAGYLDWKDANGNPAHITVKLRIANQRHLYQVVTRKK